MPTLFALGALAGVALLLRHGVRRGRAGAGPRPIKRIRAEFMSAPDRRAS